jgi:23S rRNA pseudouridine1911/1915/1917 synthase
MGRRFIDVIYEDKDIMAVNKPRGVIVAAEKGAGAQERGRTLANDVRRYLLHKFEGARGAYAMPLHRLDKETTGVILFAKSKAGLRLSADIKAHKIGRIYTAVVEGRVPDEEGVINLSLEKGDFGFGKKVGVADDGKGRPAVTQFRVIERYEDATMLEARLETGFTHQIRVHFASIGFPLAGDRIYNPHGKIKFPRQALHARQVKFRHPVNGRKMDIKAPIPPDMKGLIDRLRG